MTKVMNGNFTQAMSQVSSITCVYVPQNIKGLRVNWLANALKINPKRKEKKKG